MRKRWIWIAATVAWTLVVLFSSTSLAARLCVQLYGLAWRVLGELGVSVFTHAAFLAQKGLHVFLFVVFAILLGKCLPAAPRRWMLVLGTALALGCLSEFLQSFFPGRSPSLADVGLNFCAAAGGSLLAALARRRPSLAPNR